MIETEKARGAIAHRYDYATNYTGSENALFSFVVLGIKKKKKRKEKIEEIKKRERERKCNNAT